jgi:hypothetical protein
LGRDCVAVGEGRRLAAPRHGRRDLAREPRRRLGRQDREHQIGLGDQGVQIGQLTEPGGFGARPAGFAAPGQAGDDVEAAVRQVASDAAAHISGAQDGDGSGLHGVLPDAIGAL